MTSPKKYINPLSIYCEDGVRFKNTYREMEYL